MLGTVLLGFCATLMWLLLREQDEHAATRRQIDELNEKRLDLATKTLSTQMQVQAAITTLIDEIKRNKVHGRR